MRLSKEHIPLLHPEKKEVSEERKGGISNEHLPLLLIGMEEVVSKEE